MIPEFISAAGIFFFLLLVSHAILRKSLAIALSDAWMYDDEIQERLTEEDYQIRKKDDAILVAGTLLIVMTPFFREVYPSMLGYYFISAFLLISAIVDFKVRYSPDMFAVSVLAVAVYDVLACGVDAAASFVGMLFPGLAVLVASVFFPSIMGGADIKMLISLGACLGLLQTTSLYLFSCIAICLIYVPLLIKKKICKEDTKIFVPAILGFYIAYMMLQYEPQYLYLFDI